MRSTAIRLVAQSRDAALTAVQVFNNPLIQFKSESFIVLMNIAWTYLLHAYYRRTGIEYRYSRGTGKGRRYDRTADGSFKYWDLRKCLADVKCPLDNETRKNLSFIIGLRDEITHHMSPALDQFVSARYQEVQVRGLIATAAVRPFDRLSAARPWDWALERGRRRGGLARIGISLQPRGRSQLLGGCLADAASIL